MTEQDAETAGSQLPCQPPPSEPRRVLPAAEWVWRDKRAFSKNNQELFGVLFVLGKDPGLSVADETVGKPTIDREKLHGAPMEGRSAQGVGQGEIIKRDSRFQARLRDWLLGD